MGDVTCACHTVTARGEPAREICGAVMDETRPQEATNTSEPTDEDSSDTGGAIAIVDYAKSFHLRYAGNSTVRKKRRPRLRQRREDESEDTSTDEDYDEDGAGEENGTADSQEMRMIRELSTSIASYLQSALFQITEHCDSLTCKLSMIYLAILYLAVVLLFV